MFSLEQITQWLITYKYFLIFPLMVIEGPIITVISGFLASLGYLTLLPIYILVVLGDLVGDTIYYTLGYWGREKLLDMWGGSFLGITKERINKLEVHFDKHRGKTLILGKITHAIGVVFLFAAGLAKVPYLEFLCFNLIATMPKSFVLLLMGYYFGQAYPVINKDLGLVSVFILASSVISLVTFIIYKKYANSHLN